jgi:hypothetical protein
MMKIKLPKLKKMKTFKLPKIKKFKVPKSNSHLTIRTTASGTRYTNRVKMGNTTVTTTSGGSKKSRRTVTTRTGNITRSTTF